MTTFQSLVKNFWKADNRNCAIFEGKTITLKELSEDASLAKRYYQQQCAACECNWRNSRSQGH